MDEQQGSALGRCLQRIEASMSAIDEIRDAKARVVTKDLVEAVLDLHGIALARVLTIAQSGSDGEAMTQRLADDDYVSAALLLHGLHPEEPETRLTKRIAAMRPHWGVRGFHVEFVSLNGVEASVRVHWGDARLDRRATLREIEEVLTDAAPDSTASL